MDKNLVRIVVTFEPIMQFRCSSRFRILKTVHTTFFEESPQPNWYFGCYQQLQLLWQTDMATLWPTWHRGPVWWTLWVQWTLINALLSLLNPDNECSCYLILGKLSLLVVLYSSTHCPWIIKLQDLQQTGYLPPILHSSKHWSMISLAFFMFIFGDSL